MKKKELKKMAREMADLENIIRLNQDADEVAKAKDKIMNLTERIESFEDMLILDEMIQEILI